MIPPTKWGMKPSLCGSPCRDKTRQRLDKVIVVMVVVVVAVAAVAVVVVVVVVVEF